MNVACGYEVWMSITKETPDIQQLEAYLAHGSGQASPRRTTSIDHGKNHPSLAQLKGMSLLMLKACDMFEVAKVRAGAGQKISGPLSWDLMVTYCRMQVGKNAFMCRVYPPAFGQRLVRLWCEAEPEQQLSLRTVSFVGFETHACRKHLHAWIIKYIRLTS